MAPDAEGQMTDCSTPAVWRVDPLTDTARSRQMRVFVSSTFRDMHAERDYLVKFVFPELRRRCQSRGVIWGEVDLRWGVTDEQTAEGKVLPICLEEITRCRPYFIGILGERYGWVPDEIGQDLLEREPWLEEHLRGRKSVTELEILHGVLERQSSGQPAFFYFRDPEYVNLLPEGAAREDYVSEDADSAERLAQLKQRIRESGLPVSEGFADAEELGALVQADLERAIDDLFPEASQPSPLERETAGHEAFAQALTRVYIGRPSDYGALDRHLASPGPPLVVVGEAGSGKSALLANWVLGHRRSHPEQSVLMHFVGATPTSASWEAMLRHLLGELGRHLSIAAEVPDDPQELRAAFGRWLQLGAEQRSIVLVIDGLNQLEDRDAALDLVWLPRALPDGVRLVVSTLPGRPLEELQRRGCARLQVGPLDHAERLKLVGNYLAQFSKELRPESSERIAAAPQTASPLHLRVLLEELRLYGDHSTLD